MTLSIHDAACRQWWRFPTVVKSKFKALNLTTSA